ncbi:MAG: SDR family NAD(P)-dependent oxidoreductase, partial [Alphaproteobacteria bacterium]|nr:SDR family NAD(P)-dependent oxidoreductase [Alphaproteobacteria bacterium]
MARLFAFGCGYSARALMAALPPGFARAGTARSAARCGELAAAGITAFP